MIYPGRFPRLLRDMCVPVCIHVHYRYYQDKFAARIWPGENRSAYLQGFPIARHPDCLQRNPDVDVIVKKRDPLGCSESFNG